MTFDLLAAARDLIAADSVSARGNLRAVEVLERVARHLGLSSFRIEADALGVQHANLIVHKAPPRDGGLLLVTHTDTVGAGPRDLWTETDPLTLKVDGDRLVGLGVADVKLDALAKLQAIAAAPAATNVAFCGTFAEEVGCLGARHFVAHPPFRPAWVSCGEPSELRIIDAHKGYLVARVIVRDPQAPEAPPRVKNTFTGKAAHSSTPHLGVNAIDLALAAAPHLPVHAAEGGDLANKIPARCSLEVESRLDGATHEEVPAGGRSCHRALTVARALVARLKESVLATPPLRNDRFDPATAVANLTVLAAHNGEVTATVDARLLPGHDPEAIFARADALAAELARVHGVSVTIERDRSNHAMELPAGARLREAAMSASRALGLNPAPQAKPTNTEGGIFVHAGYEAIVFGPGVSTGNAHTANEWQSLSQVKTATAWYGRLISELP